jgi:hypothetical protein
MSLSLSPGKRFVINSLLTFHLPICCCLLFIVRKLKINFICGTVSVLFSIAGKKEIYLNQASLLLLFIVRKLEINHIFRTVSALLFIAGKMKLF